MKVPYWIKHKDYRDVCVKVNKWGVYPPYYVIKGNFWNMGTKQSYNMNIKFKEKLTFEEFKQNYLTIDIRESIPIGILSLRAAHWKPIV